MYFSVSHNDHIDDLEAAGQGSYHIEAVCRDQD
jgi:hypothetical protein